MDYDAIVVGSGPNGLAAAIQLARAGCSVCVFEGADTAGGGLRSKPLTLPGFVHDVCSAIHPLAASSPFFRGIPASEASWEWVHSPAPLAHPLDGGRAIVLERSVEETARKLGADADAYRRLFGPFVRQWQPLFDEILGPLHIPAHPLLLARFARHATRPAAALASSRFEAGDARALFAGMAGHSILSLHARPSAAFGMVLSILAHAVGWPLARGGSQRIADGLAKYLEQLGGRIVTNQPVRTLEELPRARFLMFDGTPRQLLRIAGNRLPAGYRRRLEMYRYGPGVFKLDWALSSPIPWKDPECSRAATVHVGGTLDSIASAEREVALGRHPEKPFVLAAQPSLFDASRAPAGRHTAWAYCHVPNGSTVDMTQAIEDRIEAFAPGFRDCILARHALNTTGLEAYNPNYVGGDINGGAVSLRQLAARPVLSFSPYRTPLGGVYLCSSSTPPGGGVHGMCGFHAARTALADAGMRLDSETC